MDAIPNHPVYHRNVLELLGVATEYCQFLEQPGPQPQQKLAAFLQRIFPMLYLKGCFLPEIIPEYPEAGQRFVTGQDWEYIFNAARESLGAEDIFYVFDPGGYGWGEALKASLAEHIADIYQDMKDFVLLYQNNSRAVKEVAVAECRQLFAGHWGPRIVSALPALHYIMHAQAGPYYQDGEAISDI